MRRVALILLLLALFLSGCSSRFEIEDGAYLDTESGRRYVQLGSAYQAESGGAEIGTYESKKFNYTLTLFEIPAADATRFLTDDVGTVYCADATPPDAKAWSVQSILVYEEEAFRMLSGRITDADAIAQLRALWHDGPATEKSESKLALTRRLAMVSTDCPGIYYCVQLSVYEDGTAHLFERESGRRVAVDAALLEKIPLD